MINPNFLTAIIGGEIANLVAQSGIVAKVVLLILLLFSLISWAVILSKWSSYGRARSQSGRFLRAFRKAGRLKDVAAVSEQFRPSPLVSVFEGGYEEYQRQVGNPTGSLKNVHSVHRAMQIASSEEHTRLERRLQWLATIANVAPFVGLFGTVWGVMTSFAGLANANTATLRAVAPGIADALIATAFGLFAAIPAVIAYNQFVYQMRNLGGQLDDLQNEIVAIAEGLGT